MHNDDELIKEAIALASSWQNQANRLHLEFDKEFYSIMNSIQKYPQDKIFLIELLEVIFVTNSNKRIAHVIDYLIQKYGIAEFFTKTQKALLFLFQHSTKNMPDVSIPFFQEYIKSETKKLLVYENQLDEFLERKDYQEVKTNINLMHGLTINELEAQRAIENYIRELGNPYVKSISVKISSIDSMMDLTDFDNSVERIVHKLTLIFRQAQKYPVNGCNKLIFIEMEEFTTLPIIIESFKQLLNKEEFKTFKAGITLQAYLKISLDILDDFIVWMKKRQASGGEKLIVRLVKGGNLQKEYTSCVLKPLPLATLEDKIHTDGQYKKMARRLLNSEFSELCDINIATHNIFDLAYIYSYAKQENQLKRLCFEMYDGINESLKITIQKQTKEVVTYSSVLLRDDFSNAINFLVKRVHDLTSSCSFLSHAYRLKVDSDNWLEYKEQFLRSLQVDLLIFHQNHFLCENEPVTDFRVEHNRTWLKEALKEHNNGFDKVKKKEGPSEFETLEKKAFSLNITQKIEWLEELVSYIRTNRKEFIFALKKDVVTNDKEISMAIDALNLFIQALKQYSEEFDFRCAPKRYKIIIDETFAFNDIMTLLISALMFEHQVVLEGNRHISILLAHLDRLFDQTNLPSNQFYSLRDSFKSDIVVDYVVQKNKRVKKVFYISDISNKELAIRTVFNSSLKHCLEYWGSITLLLQEDVYNDEKFLQRLTNSKNIKDKNIIYNNKQIETISVKDVYQAVELINSNPTFMSASIESLDEEEIEYFSKACLNTHLYVNKTLECESKYTLYDMSNYIDFYLPKEQFECLHYFNFFTQLEATKTESIENKKSEVPLEDLIHIAPSLKNELQTVASSYEHAYAHIFHQEHEYRHFQIEKSVIRYMKLSRVLLVMNENDDIKSLLYRIIACRVVGVEFAFCCQNNKELEAFCKTHQSILFKKESDLIMDASKIQSVAKEYDRILSSQKMLPIDEINTSLLINEVSAEGKVELRNYFKEQRYYSLSHKYGIKTEKQKGHRC